MSTVFSSPRHGLFVSQNADGSYAWSGQYNGVSIVRVIPLDGVSRCVLLLDPDASQRQAFENLLCIDRGGGAVWTARLHTSPDVFLGIVPTDEGIWANTWSGWRVLLDPNTGAELRGSFVK